jgi:steroid 5-alpha reductase family enzyme
MFQFQAALIALFSVPFVIVCGNPATRPAWLVAGAALWCLSVAGESRADSELARFRADGANRGRTCRAGLWRYSRHPNYFFEWLHWFSYAALAVGAPRAWLALTGPLFMFLFLRFVSGIPFTEAQALRTRGDDYRDYQRRTSMLFPWPPRRHLP